MLELLDELAAAGISVEVNGESLIVSPRQRLTAEMRASIRAHKDELLERLRAPVKSPTDTLVASEARRLLGLLAGLEGWADGDVEDGHDAIRRNPQDALEVFTEMLARHPQDPDGRVRCVGCRHHRHGHCGRHQKAGLSSSVVVSDFARLPQLCAVFEHGPGPVVVLEPLRPRVDIHFERMTRLFAKHRAALDAAAWTQEELLAPGTNKARTDAGPVWVFAGFDLVGLEVTTHTIVGVVRDGSRMTYTAATK